MGDIKIVGMEKLQKKLKKNVRLDDVKRVVRTQRGRDAGKGAAQCSSGYWTFEAEYRA